MDQGASIKLSRTNIGRFKKKKHPKGDPFELSQEARTKLRPEGEAGGGGRRHEQ